MNYSGRPEKTYKKITASVLAKLYGVSKYTIKVWIKNEKLDPSDLLDIIRLFNQRVLRKEHCYAEQ